MTTEPKEETLGPLLKLARETRQLATGLDRSQARGLVDLYYRWQEHRISLANQSRAAVEAEEPSDLMDHFGAQTHTMERQIASVLDAWTSDHPLSMWAKSQHGIGPILAAGLRAHVDHERLTTAGQLWRFAGLDPSVTWGKGQKRPWNADLKVLVWKITTSFVRSSGSDNSFYGPLYRERKEWEIDKNESGGNAEAAARVLDAKKIRAVDTRAAYEAGILPPGHVDARARRWVGKLFLAHYFETGYRVTHHGEAPALPYVITSEKHPTHSHTIEPPGPVVW